MIGADELRADCTACVGLCCVALELTASADFAIDKPAGTPCPHLDGHARCDIHGELSARGFPGCVAYDCFGAGQRLVRRYGGPPPDPTQTLARLRALHELLWYLDDVRIRPACRSLADEIDAAVATVEQHAEADPRTLDVDGIRAAVAPLLRRASDLVRADDRVDDRAGTDLVGASLSEADLRGVTFRGALLLGADLHDADLRRADLLGADLRGADLRGARLDDALFATPGQLGAARGDRRTTLPPRLVPPPHWN